MTHKPPFNLEYRHAGRTYSATIWANDWQDAEAHVRSITHTGAIVGSDVVEINAGPVVLPLSAICAWIMVWWKNRGRG